VVVGVVRRVVAGADQAEFGRRPQPGPDRGWLVGAQVEEVAVEADASKDRVGAAVLRAGMVCDVEPRAIAPWWRVSPPDR
jgi:hypothetical protein